MKKDSKKFDLQLFADFLTNYGVSLQIDITPTAAATLTELGVGFDNLDEALNEVIQQYQFLDKNGYGESEVTGMQPVISLTGVRRRSDAAQNFIFSKKYEILDERKTDLVLTYVDNADATVTITFENVTMANIKEFGGASTDGSAISVEFHSSKKPVIS